MTPSNPTASDQSVFVTIVIQNTGNQPITTPFWVDMTVNPSHSPQTNELWNMVCTGPCYGAVLSVNTPIPAGGSVTLTSNNILPEYSNWPGTLFDSANNITVWVDSYGASQPYGTIQESNEADNSASITGFLVTN